MRTIQAGLRQAAAAVLLSPAARRWLGAAGLLGCLLAGCGAIPATPTALGNMEADYGISVHSLNLSAHGYILDMRYRVDDPDKAALLLDGHQTVQLVDAARHARLGVPQSPIIGNMRQTARNHVIYTDRDYFILFVNPGRAVQPGDVLQLAVGSQTLGSLVVK